MASEGESGGRAAELAAEKSSLRLRQLEGSQGENLNV